MEKIYVHVAISGVTYHTAMHTCKLHLNAQRIMLGVPDYDQKDPDSHCSLATTLLGDLGPLPGSQHGLSCCEG